MSCVIKPSDLAESYRMAGLKNVNRERIEQALGFPPNMQDDPTKVTASWSFTVDGVPCAVWDYKGSFNAGRASAYGPIEALVKVFGANNVTD